MSYLFLDVFDHSSSVPISLIMVNERMFMLSIGSALQLMPAPAGPDLILVVFYGVVCGFSCLIHLFRWKL